MSERIEITETAPGTVFELRRTIRADRLATDIGTALTELYAKAAGAGLHPAGPPSVTYLGHVEADRPVPVDVSVAVAPGTGHAEVGDGARIVGRHARPAVRTVHEGDYRTIGTTYRALEEWTAGHGYRPAGPPTETYLVGPADTVDPAGYRTEICMPIMPSIGLTVSVAADVDTAAQRTRKALATHGFTTLWETNLRTVLGQGHAGLEEILVIGVCVPDLAARMIEADRQVAMLLPGTVVVRTVEGGSLVEALDPAVLPHVTGLPELDAVARDLRKRLDAVLASLHDTAS